MTIELLAKSRPPLSLFRHLQDVHDAADAIFGQIENDFAKSGLLVDQVRLVQLLKVACLLHDVMKANSAFQQMVHSSGSPQKQPVRHEALAAVLLATGPLAEWFSQLVPEKWERWALLWAIAGHHFQLRRDIDGGIVRDTETRRLTIHLDHPDVMGAFAEVERVLVRSIATPPRNELQYDTADDDEGLRDMAREFLSEGRRAWQNLQNRLHVRSTVALLKGLLIAADVSGSAIAERGALTPADWVNSVLCVRLRAADLDPVIVKGTKGKDALPFQRTVGVSDKTVTLVAAGCGNGKTTAAYLWAQKHAAGKKLFFTYPTTGTATAGYAGYLADQHELLADLIHMRSAVDLESIHGTTEDRDDDAIRIESLRVWDSKIVVCTVDTVLGLLQVQRRAIYSFPAFLAGAFVFDEVHSYDCKLFGGLLRFLQEFPGIPCLIMSASIPPKRLERLRAVLADPAREVIRGDPELEGHKRYRLESRPDAQSCWSDVKAALDDDNRKKVLWVCNTVGDAIRMSREAKEKSGVAPVIYHSRFRYQDRVKRQNDLIEAFRKPGPILAITTQVCEMSLDISANLLVTAECPLPALVQRLGRHNRYATGDNPWPCLVYPFSGLPYNENPARVDLDGDYIVSMKACREAVTELAGKPISQRDLAQQLDRMQDDERFETESMLFDGGWSTEPMPVRKGGEDSITVILARDCAVIEAKLGKVKKRWSAGKLAPWTIPMNRRRGLSFTEWAGPYPIATDDILSYSETEGAQWK